jgi:hypothetical protein
MGGAFAVAAVPPACTGTPLGWDPAMPEPKSIAKTTNMRFSGCDMVQDSFDIQGNRWDRMPKTDIFLQHAPDVTTYPTLQLVWHVQPSMIGISSTSNPI